MSISARHIAMLGALLGIFASAYLLIDYVWGSGICLTGSGCDTVRQSAFAYPLGIPLPLPGLLYYAAAAAFIGLAPSWLTPRARAGALAAWSLIGVMVMAGLTAIEVFVIHAFCAWCLLSAFASILLAAGALLDWHHAHSRTEEPRGRSARALRQARDVTAAADRSLRRFSLTTAWLLAVAFAALLIAPALASPQSQLLNVPSARRPTLGNGPVQVAVFSDFQCPACAVAAPSLSQLARTGRITLTYRFFPLTSIHANARTAAAAALAAERQGHFWDFHDALFARQQEWASQTAAGAEAAFAGIAGSIGLDVPSWTADTRSAGVVDVVDADEQAAKAQGLTGTPSIFINGSAYQGRLDYDSLAAAVAAATTPAP